MPCSRKQGLETSPQQALSTPAVQRSTVGATTNTDRIIKRIWKGDDSVNKTTMARTLVYDLVNEKT